MLDKITLVNNNIPETKKKQIINKNNLQKSVLHGVEIWDNKQVKNFTGGILIQIKNNTIKIEGSIHKFYEWIQGNPLENYTLFTMKDCQKAFLFLLEHYGLNGLEFFVKTYEIGLNIYTGAISPIEILDKVQSIGILNGKQRKLYVNPRYQKERFLTTEMSKNNVLVFRIYDKNHERADKGRKNEIPNCVRIETLRTRQKEVLFSEFITPENLTNLQNIFFSEWNLLNFEKEIKAPKGTHQRKKDLAKNIILHGKNKVLKELEDKRPLLTPKIYRTEKEFINCWEAIKYDYTLTDCQIMPKWATLYNTAYQQVIKITTKN